MASHLSGSREDVELILIETDDLSLVMKGKPYHERYEGFKQYQSMDFHDAMELSIHGEGIQSVQVYDVNRQRLVESAPVTKGYRPIFFENGTYQLIVLPKKKVPFTFYHEHPLLREAVSNVTLGSQTMLTGSLSFQNEVGFSTFEIRSEKKTWLEVTIEVFPTKLDYKKDYVRLLEEVNDEIYNLAYHFIRKTYLGAAIKLDGKPSMAEFYRLMGKHFDQFFQAVKQIEVLPHHLLQNEYVKARGDGLRKLDSRSRGYLRKRPTLFVEVENGMEIGHRTLLPTEGLRIKNNITHDTLENRFVKYMITRLTHKLDDLKARIQRQSRWGREESDANLIERVEGMMKRLDSTLKSPFWRGIGKLDRSVHSLVLQMAPGYRDAYQIFLMVSKGLALQGEIYKMSVKDVATLYEYWTFLKLGQILSRKYELLSQDIVKVNRKGLFVNLDVNQTSKRVFQHPITKEKIILTYQKYERKLPTVPQQPDMMLSIEKKGKDYSYHYIFDAKYRIDYAKGLGQTSFYIPGPMEEDINTMHRYRDSIVMANLESYERTAFGAYVLFPFGNEDFYKEHRFYKSIDKVNIGALPFLPNATMLVEQFVERLIDSSPEELQEEGILPRGAKEQWLSALDEKVLVGLVSSKEDYTSFVREGCYKIAAYLLKKGWQEIKWIALYAKSGVAHYHGVLEYGKITDVTFEEVEGKEYVCFHVEYWRKLKQTIRPVYYGIANYTMTTIDTLKEAQELPELFMKTKNEMVLWRMLRRVSDRVRLELDRENLDEANGIESFSFKDIRIEIAKESGEVIFKNRNHEKKISFEILEKNPSYVFKLLVRFMESSGG